MLYSINKINLNMVFYFLLYILLMSNTKSQKAITIAGVEFDGTNNINLPGVNMIGNQDTTGNANSATSFKNPIIFGGIKFYGNNDISLAGVNYIGNQDTTGNSATASKLKNRITIGGVPFDGTKNIDLPGVNTISKVGTLGIAMNAIGLYFKPTIGGIIFDGSNNIDLPGVNISGTQNTSGKSGSSVKADALISSDCKANIVLKDSDIYYCGENHHIEGNIINPEITRLKETINDLVNELDNIKKGLDSLLLLQDLPII
jgi:hypothetical protein